MKTGQVIKVDGELGVGCPDTQQYLCPFSLKYACKNGHGFEGKIKVQRRSDTSSPYPILMYLVPKER